MPVRGGGRSIDYFSTKDTAVPVNHSKKGVMKFEVHGKMIFIDGGFHNGRVSQQ